MAQSPWRCSVIYSSIRNYPKIYWLKKKKKTCYFHISQLCRSGIQMVSTWTLWFRSTISGTPAWMLLMDMAWTAGAGQTSLYPHYSICVWLVWVFLWHRELRVIKLFTSQLDSCRVNVHRGEEQDFISIICYCLPATDSERRGYTRLWIPRGMVHLRRPSMKTIYHTKFLILTEGLWLVNISGSDDVNSSLPEIEKLLGRLRIEYTEIF